MIRFSRIGRLHDPSAVLLLITFLSMACRLFSNIALAHLLAPHAFGIVAITSLVATGLTMISDTGAWLAIVRKGERLEEGWLNQLWTLQVIRGVLLWATMAVLGPFMANAYSEPLLAYLLPVTGLSLALAGAQSLEPLARARELRPGLNLKVQLVSQVAGSTVSIICALIYSSPWALASGIIVSSAVAVALSFSWSAKSFPKLHLTIGFAREQWQIASWLGLSSGLLFLSSQVDKLLFAPLFGLATFGVYTIAVTLAGLPLQVGQRWADGIYMPAIAKFAEKGSVGAEQLRRLSKLVTIYVGLACGMLVGVGRPFFLVFYPLEFAPAAAFVQLLGAGTYATLLAYLHRRAFLYHGMTRFEVFIEAGRLSLFVVGLLLAIRLAREFGATEYVALFAAVQWLVYIGLLLIGRCRRLIHLRDDVPAHFVFISMCALLTAVDSEIASHAGALVTLTATATFGALICVFVGLRLGLPKLPDDRRSDSVNVSEKSVPF